MKLRLSPVRVKRAAALTARCCWLVRVCLVLCVHLPLSLPVPFTCGSQRLGFIEPGITSDRRAGGAVYLLRFSDRGSLRSYGLQR